MQFTLSDVLSALKRLGISFNVTGTDRPGPYGFKSLRAISDGGIYYVASGLELPALRDSVVICAAAPAVDASNVLIEVANPQLAFYRLMELLLTAPAPKGIHPTAVIDPEAEVSPDCYIGPYCVIDKCVIEAGVRLHSHVVVMDNSHIERDVTIESHTTIGATGVAWVWDPEARRRVVQPQVGSTLIGAGAFLGTDVTVVRGSVNETTRVGSGTVIAHGSKIGHGAQVGDDCHFANNVSIAGNVVLGDRCFLGSAAVVRPQVRLGPATTVGAGAVVVKDCLQPGQMLVGVPAKPANIKAQGMTGVPRALDAEDTE